MTRYELLIASIAESNVSALKLFAAALLLVTLPPVLAWIEPARARRVVEWLTALSIIAAYILVTVLSFD